MLFDSLMVRAVVSHLRDRACGSRVMRVFQTSRVQTIIELSVQSPPGQLVLSSSSEFGRIHLDDGWEPDPTVHYPVGAVLQRWLRSAVLVDVNQRQFDRAVRLEFGNARGLGPQARCYVVLETMGRHSNLIVLDEDAFILEAARHVTADVNRYRQILPGLEYVPPPSFDKLDPSELSSDQIISAASESDGTVSDWFRTTFQGASDVFRGEVLARCDISPRSQVGDLQAADLERLHVVLDDLLNSADGTEAWTYTCSDGAFAYPVRLQSLPDCRTERSSDMSAAVAVIARAEMAKAEIEQERRQLLQAAERTLGIVDKRIAERKDVQQRSEDADSIRRIGEAILASLREIRAGATTVSLDDPYKPGRKLEVMLDPRLTAQTNAQKYFARYKKLTSVRSRITALLRAALRERHYLEGLLDQIEQADDLGDLRLLEEEMAGQGYLRKRRKRGPAQQARVEVQSAEVLGYAILWGKSGLQNDKLLRAAGPDDIWLHTRKTPGGHVLIRSQGRPDEVPEAVLVAAARHAAWLSKRRADTRVAVDYAPARHVRRLKGTPPGYVHYTNHKTVMVQPESIEA